MIKFYFKNILVFLVIILVVCDMPANVSALRPAADQVSDVSVGDFLLPLEEGLQRLEELIIEKLELAEKAGRKSILVVIDGMPGVGSTWLARIIQKTGIAGVPPRQIGLIERDKMSRFYYNIFSWIRRKVSLGSISPKRLKLIEGLDVAHNIQEARGEGSEDKMLDLFINVVADDDTRLLRIDKKMILPGEKMKRFFCAPRSPASFDLVIDNSIPDDKKDKAKLALLRQKYEKLRDKYPLEDAAGTDNVRDDLHITASGQDSAVGLPQAGPALTFTSVKILAILVTKA